MFHVRGVTRIIFTKGKPNFDIFLQSYFEANRGTKTALGGSGGMLSRKISENLHIAMAILVLFEQFLGKFY